MERCRFSPGLTKAYPLFLLDDHTDRHAAMLLIMPCCTVVLVVGKSAWEPNPGSSHPYHPIETAPALQKERACVVICEIVMPGLYPVP